MMRACIPHTKLTAMPHPRQSEPRWKVMPEGSKEAAQSGDDESVLTISPEKVCFIIIKAREFDVKDVVTDPDPGSISPMTRTPPCSKTIATIPSSRN